MKTKDDYQKATDEIASVCKKHGVFLLGTCESEGIYGEIALGDSANPDACGWRDPAIVLTNNVEDGNGTFIVSGIGEI